MFGFFSGSKRGRDSSTARRYSPFAGSPENSRNRAVGQTIDDNVEIEENDEQDNDVSPHRQLRRPTSYFDNPNADEYEDEEEDDAADDEDAVATPLLPLFSSAHLDRLPLYNVTHAIRLLVVQKCETTLSWEQLRSPQISQFLVKPIQGQIRTNHFNRATLCALITNCLQFQREGQLHPGNVGVSKTRALISELLAMRLVKEFSTRELIDALSYDFDPLQGMSPPPTANAVRQRTQGWAGFANQESQVRGARVSTIEVAIKAQAKRFLAHPLVVQHLEAIWAGTIVFHFEADNLHRKPSAGEEPFNRGRRYGTVDDNATSALPADSVLSRKAHETRTNKRPSDTPVLRRSVTLYNPKDASLFKLSRLRVPRYRQLFSTVSFATMLGLFLAVLINRNLYITPLEVLFWVWSIGYMLDEVVGFTEQGFGLYILSFWNAFDLGILLLFVVYYCLRLYGILLAEEGKHRIADAAYDVLASTAILLFPRLFSVLDHYRYFSQLLIAFRMMAVDLMAILILIIISCSGFFVAFTLSFSGKGTDGKGVAFALFQILMGFTPAAWEQWPGYSLLGKAIMTVFLIICHFVIVTILITVLTNSFMSIVQNANEEHQYLFAINTISTVKSDTLFGYIAPTNVLGWLCSPLRYIMPFRQYVKLNRTIIKVSHFPILLLIFGYERLMLSQMAYAEIDLVEQQPQTHSKPLSFSMNQAQGALNHSRRLIREPSVISFRKDQALEEVFRRPYRGSTVRTTTQDMERRPSGNVVDQWMKAAEVEGGASPPLEQPRSVVERLENRRPPFKRAVTSDRIRMAKRSREISMATRSMASDPELMSTVASRRPYKIDEEAEEALLDQERSPLSLATDADADDEHNAESDLAGPAIGESAVSVLDKENRSPNVESDTEDFFQTPTASKSPMMQLSSPAPARLLQPPAVTPGYSMAHPTRPRPKGMYHARKISSGTTLFAPLQPQADDTSSSNAARPSKPRTAKNTNTGGTVTPAPITLPSGQRTPKLKPARARPIMPPRQKTAPAPATGVGMTFIDVARGVARQPSLGARALDLASEIGDNKWGPTGGIDAGGLSGMPASFSEQLLRERDFAREREAERRRNEEEEKGMVNRIMLARMHTLEEGFREVLKEIKDISRSTANSSRRDSDAETSHMVKEPTTPSRKPSLGDNKGANSPKKHGPRGAKAKTGQRPTVKLQVDEPSTPSPESAQSIVERPKEDEVATSTHVERPSTAVRTPDQGHKSE